MDTKKGDIIKVSGAGKRNGYYLMNENGVGTKMDWRMRAKLWLRKVFGRT